MFTDLLYCILLFIYGVNAADMIKKLPSLPSLLMNDSIDNLVAYLPFYKLCTGKYNCQADVFITVFSIYFLIIVSIAFILSNYFECIEQISYFFKKNKIRKLKYYKIHRAIAITAFFPVFIARYNILLKYYVEMAMHMGLIGMWYYIIPLNNYQKDLNYKRNLFRGNILLFVGIIIGLQ